MRKPARPLSVLVMENYPPDRIILSNFLRKNGCEVIEVFNSDQAIQALGESLEFEQPFDLVVLSGKNPGLDAAVESLKLLGHRPAGSVADIFVIPVDAKARQSLNLPEAVLEFMESEGISTPVFVMTGGGAFSFEDLKKRFKQIVGASSISISQGVGVDVLEALRKLQRRKKAKK